MASADRRTTIDGDQITDYTVGIQELDTFNFNPLNRQALRFDEVSGKLKWVDIIPQFPFTALDCGNIYTDRVLTYYDNAGGQDVTNGAVILFNTTTPASDLFAFSVASGIVTVNTSGKYFITYDVTIDNTINERTNTEIKMEIDTGSGFTVYTGSLSYTYNRNNQHGNSTASCSMLLELNVGDKIRVFATRFSGDGVIHTFANASRLNIYPQISNGEQKHFEYDCGDLANSSNEINNQLDCGGLS